MSSNTRGGIPRSHLRAVPGSEGDFLSPPAPPVDKQAVSAATTLLLKAVGEDPSRAGLEDTPNRVARMYEEILSGYRQSVDDIVNGALFEVAEAEDVFVRAIPFHSLCEHHLLPFYGVAHVAYRPCGKVIGLSKIPRIVDMYARRLQIQERMTGQIAACIAAATGAAGVAVVVEGVHMCATMRGVRKADSRMVTASMLGCFHGDAALRRELQMPLAPW